MDNSLIKHQAAIDEWKNDFKGYINALNMPKDDYNGIVEYINELPSAQPEIIYCKKCKHWTRTCGDEQWSLGDCDVFDKHLVMCNGYCAWAERREDGDGRD